MKRTAYAYTDNLHMQLKQVNPDQFREIHRGIDFYMDQYEELKEQYGGMTTAYNFLENAQQIIDEQMEISDMKVECHKGCSLCCQINVDITEDEAELLVKHVADARIDIDINKLERQSKADAWLKQTAEDRKCQFLDKDGACKVYEYRPMNCRRHLVITEPELCDAIKYPKGEVGRMSVFEAEAITTAIMTTCKTDSMPKLLLEKIYEVQSLTGS